MLVEKETPLLLHYLWGPLVVGVLCLHSVDREELSETKRSFKGLCEGPADGTLIVSESHFTSTSLISSDAVTRAGIRCRSFHKNRPKLTFGGEKLSFNAHV